MSITDRSLVISRPSLGCICAYRKLHLLPGLLEVGARLTLRDNIYA